MELQHPRIVFRLVSTPAQVQGRNMMWRTGANSSCWSEARRSWLGSYKKIHHEIRTRWLNNPNTVTIPSQGTPTTRPSIQKQRPSYRGNPSVQIERKQHMLHTHIHLILPRNPKVGNLDNPSRAHKSSQIRRQESTRSRRIGHYARIMIQAHEWKENKNNRIQARRFLIAQETKSHNISAVWLARRRTASGCLHPPNRCNLATVSRSTTSRWQTPPIRASNICSRLTIRQQQRLTV